MGHSRQHHSCQRCRRRCHLQALYGHQRTFVLCERRRQRILLRTSSPRIGLLRLRRASVQEILVHQVKQRLSEEIDAPRRRQGHQVRQDVEQENHQVPEEERPEDGLHLWRNRPLVGSRSFLAGHQQEEEYAHLH